MYTKWIARRSFIEGLIEYLIVDISYYRGDIAVGRIHGTGDIFASPITDLLIKCDDSLISQFSNSIDIQNYLENNYPEKVL